MKSKRTISILFPLTVLLAVSAALSGILSGAVYSRELPSAAVRFVSRDYILLMALVPFSIITFLNRLKNI